MSSLPVRFLGADKGIDQAVENIDRIVGLVRLVNNALIHKRSGAELGPRAICKT